MRFYIWRRLKKAKPKYSTLNRLWRAYLHFSSRRIIMNKLYLFLTILRYACYAPISIAATFVVWLTSWLLPVFSFCTKDEELPKWLRWAQTHDNSLSSLWRGSEGAKHRANNAYPWLYKYTNEQIEQSLILKYLARMFWLIRNPAYGVAHNILGFVNRNAPLIYRSSSVMGEAAPSWWWLEIYDAGHGGWNRYSFVIRSNWQYSKSRYFRIYLGFKGVSSIAVSPNFMLTTHLNPLRKVD